MVADRFEGGAGVVGLPAQAGAASSRVKVRVKRALRRTEFGTGGVGGYFMTTD